ncbi:hypothetical protein [Devosia sp. A16]|uniref:hypothetical protein n=1 Tax=Devosia sp. A16 TaxID=1736675 RepID=UPI0006D77C5B|nr:hypothetical protein [Devosia sp. A16]
MSLQRLARELDETARQTAGMVEGVTQALELLADTSLAADEARRQAARIIVNALQGQDRIEQRCQNMALAVRQFALLPPDAPRPFTTRSGRAWCSTSYASPPCRAARVLACMAKPSCSEDGAWAD